MAFQSKRAAAAKPASGPKEVPGFSTPAQISSPVTAAIAPGLSKKQLTFTEQQQKAANDLVAKAKNIVVTDQQSLEYAVMFVKQVKIGRKTWEGFTKPVTTAVDQALKSIRAHFRPVTQAWDDAEEMVVARINEYNTAVERKRLEDQAAQQQENDQALLKAKEDLNKSAEKMDKKGNTGVAEKLRDQADSLTAGPIAAQERPAVEGMATRKSLKFDVVDITQLPPEMLLVNEPAILDAGRAKMAELYGKLEKGQMTKDQYDAERAIIVAGVRFFYHHTAAITA